MGVWPGRVNKRNSSQLQGFLSFALSAEKAQIPICPQNDKGNHSPRDASDPRMYRFRQSFQIKRETDLCYFSVELEEVSGQNKFYS